MVREQKDIKGNNRMNYLNIPESENWESVTPIEKGWSKDRKFLVKTIDGELQLLRLSAGERYEAKKKEYEIISKYSTLGIPMSMPIAFGRCNDGQDTYMLLSWVEGKDLEEVLPGLSEEDQYRLGRQAGEILRKIHSIPLALEDVPEFTKREKKLVQLAQYECSSVRIPDDEPAIRFVRDHINDIWTVPPVYLHGDFHPGNLIYRSDGSIGVIDFNRWEVGDPYEDFYKLESFVVELSIPYCIGEIDAYFHDGVPEEFWLANAEYVAHASLYSIKWAEPFGQKDVDGMVERALTARADFDNFQNIIPKWYAAAKEMRG